jgi:hypothetical protein
MVVITIGRGILIALGNCLERGQKVTHAKWYL